MKKLILVILFCLFLPLEAWSACTAPECNYAIEILYPSTSAGTYARHNYAYPSDPYKIRCAAHRGAWPYTWDLTVNPSGMTIDTNTGEITWTAAASGTHNVTARVTDAQSNTATVSWTITISSSQFIFFQDGYSGTKTGTKSQPYEDMADWWPGDGSSKDHDKMMVFRSGTYSMPDYTDLYLGQYSHIYDYRMKADRVPYVMFGYPGETATIDMNVGTNKWARISTQEPDTYIGYLTFSDTNCYAIELDTGDVQYSTFQELIFGNLENTGGLCNSTNNESYFRFVVAAGRGDPNIVIQGNTFGESQKGCCIKVYSSYHTLIEDNYFGGATGSECLALKSSAHSVTTQGNTFAGSYGGESIGGGQSDFYTDTTDENEIRYNNVFGGEVVFNRNGGVEEMFVYRNVFALSGESIGVQHEDGNLPGMDITFSNNAFVTSDSGTIQDYNGSGGWSESADPNHNLKDSYPSDDLNETTGELENDWAAYIGTKGWQISGADVTAPTLSSATVATNGTTLTLVFSENVTQGIGYTDADWDVDCSIGGDGMSVTYSSGDGTNTHIYTIGTIYSGETCNIDFDGSANSEEDGSGNDLVAIVSDSVTNNSTQTPANSTPTITVDEPDGVADGVTVGDNYTVQLDLADSDDVVTANCHYDSDNSGLDGTVITGACATVAEGTNQTCSWDTTGVTPGNYYVYCKVNDGTNPEQSDYSNGQVSVNAVPAEEEKQVSIGKPLLLDGFILIIE
jgi:hypothetical protein